MIQNIRELIKSKEVKIDNHTGPHVYLLEGNHA